MQRNPFPIVVHPSAAVRRLLGPALDTVAGLALRALLRRSIEVAHQQIAYRSHDLAFSSRIGSLGDLIIEMDLGDPRLADRVIIEEDLRKAARANGHMQGGDGRVRGDRMGRFR
ncbi:MULTISPECIES: hypothetical protein [Bosea]|jgi:hypothetical protein|uniref:Uncharacterized protein n=1 Tax=Bosea vaviloviae TaxID=1526658 RepID=A0A0N0MA54_9HYPH|nr:hypothetical protein [Bosea vaviloviae]KPH77810.1 hypothetical protein AE618_21775 [Bosea vaviloviae]